MQTIAYYIFSFESTSETMEAENALKEENIVHALMPTPRAVQASCGLSVRVSEDDYGAAQDLISSILKPGRYHCYTAVSEDGHIQYLRK